MYTENYRKSRIPRSPHKEKTILSLRGKSNKQTKTYAQIVDSNQNVNNNKTDANDAQEQNVTKNMMDIMEMLKQLMTQLTTMNNLLITLTNQLTNSRNLN